MRARSRICERVATNILIERSSRKSIIALAAVSTFGIGALVPTTADANWGGRYGWYGKHHHYAPYRGFYGYRYSYGPRFFVIRAALFPPWVEAPRLAKRRLEIIRRQQ